jgi:hypothetical protein
MHYKIISNCELERGLELPVKRKVVILMKVVDKTFSYTQKEEEERKC